MAEVISRSIDTRLPVSVLLTFVLAVAMAVLSFDHPRVFMPLAIVFGFAWIVSSYMLGKVLHRTWQRHRYPPQVGLTIAAFWGCMAFAGWWLSPGSSDSPEVSERKRDLCTQASHLAAMLGFALASLPFITWGAPFLLAVVAAMVIAWKYGSLTLDYLSSDD